MALNVGTPGEIPSCFNLLITNIDAIGPFLRISGQINKNSAAIVEQLLATADPDLRTGKGALPPGIVLSQGSLCLVQYKHSAFYRARVLNCRDGHASVLYIDYGNRDTVPLSDMRALDHFPPQLAKIPGLATEYILAGGAHSRGKWEDSTLASLQSGLCGQEFPCTVEAKLSRWITISIPYNGGKLIDYLITVNICMPIPDAQQAYLLNQLSDCAFVPTMPVNPPETYPDHAVPYPNRGFPSNPAAAMRMQSYSPHNGSYVVPDPTYTPPSAISQRLQAHRTAPRNPAHLRPLQKIPPMNTATEPAPSEPVSAHNATPGSPPRKTTTYKSRLLEVNSEHKVCVSFARDGPELFAVQLASEAFRLKEMMSEINKLPHRSLTEPPMIGTVCLGRMSGDRTICRAIVMNICGSQCKLFFVDFGDTEMVSYYDIFDIPEQFVKPSVYALRFCLSGLSELKKGPALNEAFRHLVELKKVTLRVVTPEGPPLIQYGELYIDGRSVLELLKSTSESLELKVLEALPAGTTVSALVSYVDSCHKFFIQLSDNIDLLNEVMGEVEMHCKSTPPLMSVREGSPCCALFPDDGVWYRAQVVEARGERALVCYVDYGNEQEVDLSELRPINAKLLDMPAQAIKCALKGFEDKPIDQMQSNQLEMLALERTLRASVVGHVETGAVLVSLVHDAVTPPIDIARKMAQLSRPPNVPRVEKQAPPPAEPSSPESDAGERNRFRSDRLFREDRRSFRHDDTRAGGGKPWERGQETGDWNDGSGGKPNRDRDFGKKEEQWNDSHDHRENKDWGEKKERGDRPPRRENKDYERKDTWGDKKENFPKKNFSDRGDRNNGERNFADRNAGEKNFGDRNSGERNFGDRNPRERRERKDFPPREKQERSFDANRSFGSNRSLARELSNPVPLDTPFKSPEIELGSQLEVSIAWFTSPYNFYAQITSHQATFTEIMNRIPQMYKGIKPYSGSIDIGSSVLARFPEDRVLYRATIMGVQPFGKYIVQYVDFGNKTLVESKDIWQLDQELVDLPRMAVQCSLLGVKPLDKDWVKSKEMDLCFNAPRYQCVFSEVESDVYKVSLWNNSVNVAETLAEKGLAGLDVQSAVTLKDEPIDLTIIVGQEILCHVTHAEGLARFHVQLDTEKAKAVERIVDSADKTKLEPLAAGSVCAGAHCVTVYEERVYRAVLEDATDAQAVRARLPDYGYCVTVPSTSLYTLPTELSIYYYQSLVCRFNNYDENSKRLMEDEEVVARLKGNKFIMYINHVEGNSLVSTLYDLSGSKLCLFEPDDGAFPSVSPLSPRAVFNYNFGTAYLTHAESLAQIYLQRASDEAAIAEMLERLFKFYEEGAPENLEAYEEGDLCAAKSSDGNWYRAVMLKPGDETIAVQFVDYGNSEDLPKESIKKLDPKFHQPCCLAIVVSLGLTPLRDDAVTKLTEILSEQEVAVTLTIGDEGWLANLHLNGEDISLKLVNDQYATPQVVPAVAETAALALPTGTVQVYIAHIDTPGQFWLQMADKVDKIEEIQAELQENSASYAELETKDMGTLCVAKYSVDDMWYRAEVLDSDADITTVRFIDYGNTDVLDNVPGVLKVMPDHLKEIEKFAVKSSVNAVPTGTGQWSEPASDYFTELVGNTSAPLDAQIVLKDVTTYVDIFVKGENLTDKLVAENHATRSDEAECGDLASCFASHVNSPSEFWIQLESSTADLQAMETAMVDCENFPELTSKDEGTLCAAKYPEDGCWYRAQIIVEGSEGIEVLFMDYGNASIATELRQLPEELMVKPALSRKCALQKPRDIKTWSRKSEQKFNEMAAEGATIFNVQFIASGDVSIVELFLEGKSVTEELAALCEAPPASERPAPVGQELLSNGVVSHVNSLSDFYFKVENADDKMAKSLEAAETFEDATDVKVGSVVAALWDEDGLWYRAKIIELCDVGAHVVFFDYGNKSKCDKFKQLPEEIASVEPLAKHCALVSFQTNVIDEQLSKAFHNLVEDREKVFQIEFLNTTKEPRLVRLLLDGEDVCNLLKQNETDPVLEQQETGTENVSESPLKSESPSKTGSPVKSASPVKTESPMKTSSVKSASSSTVGSPVKSASSSKIGSPVKSASSSKIGSPLKSAISSKIGSPVKSATSSKTGSPVKSASPVKTDSPVKSASPVKSCSSKTGSPLKSTSPIKTGSPVKSPSSSKNGSPVKSTSSIKSASPVESESLLNSPVKSGDTLELETSELEESLEVNITVIENMDDSEEKDVTSKLSESEANEEFITPQSTSKNDSVKSDLDESAEQSDVDIQETLETSEVPDLNCTSKSADNKGEIDSEKLNESASNKSKNDDEKDSTGSTLDLNASLKSNISNSDAKDVSINDTDNAKETTKDAAVDGESLTNKEAGEKEAIEATKEQNKD